MPTSNLELIDPITFRLLSELDGSDGMRYVELRNKLGTGDSTLANRLNMLAKQGYIQVKAIRNEGGRNFVAYELSHQGQQYVARHKIKELVS